LVRPARFRFRGFFWGGLRALAFFRLPHLVNVRQIARPSRSKFRGYQIFARNETRPQITRLVNNVLNPPLPCLIKLYAGNCCENIDADRFPPHPKKRAGFRKVSESGANSGRQIVKSGRAYPRMPDFKHDHATSP
jgi:hypothetical protein